MAQLMEKLLFKINSAEGKGMEFQCSFQVLFSFFLDACGVTLQNVSEVF